MCESVERQTSVSTYGLAWKINVQSEILGIVELWEGWWSTEVINTMELLQFIVRQKAMKSGHLVYVTPW